MPDEIRAQSERLSEEGKTPLFFAREGELCGIIAVADTVKEDSPQAIKEMQNMGILRRSKRRGKELPEMLRIALEDVVTKEVHWYLMTADNYHSKPQREEFFVDSGYYKFYEAYHLLKFSNEKQILEKAYNEYLDLKRSNLWGNRKYF